MANLPSPRFGTVIANAEGHFRELERVRYWLALAAGTAPDAARWSASACRVQQPASHARNRLSNSARTPQEIARRVVR